MATIAVVDVSKSLKCLARGLKAFPRCDWTFGILLPHTSNSFKRVRREQSLTAANTNSCRPPKQRFEKPDLDFGGPCSHGRSFLSIPKLDSTGHPLGDKGADIRLREMPNVGIPSEKCEHNLHVRRIFLPRS